MGFVAPGAGLTQPGIQGIVETGVFFTAFNEFEWYLILERWLPLGFLNRSTLSLVSVSRDFWTAFVSQPGVGVVAAGLSILFN